MRLWRDCGVERNGAARCMRAVEAAVRLRQVRRTWDRNRDVRGEVELTAEALTAFAGMRQADVARSFGVGVSTLKRACRRLGIERWRFLGIERQSSSDSGGSSGRPVPAEAASAGQMEPWFLASTGSAESAESAEEVDLWFLANTRSAEEGSDLCFIACD